jgi:hypothetical protein
MSIITRADMEALAVRLNNTYVNFDGAYGNQCWDSVAYICSLLGWPVVDTVADGSSWSGYAGTMYRGFPQNNAVAAAYTKVSPAEPAMPGDIVVWGAVPGLYPLTHTATAVADAGLNILTLSQNSSAARPDLPGYSSDSSGPIILQLLPKKGLLGYLRKTDGLALNGTINTPEEEMANSQMELQTAVQTVLMSNKIVKGPRSAAEALSQLLDSTDTIGARALETNKGVAELKELLGQLLESTNANRSTQYLKGRDKPEVYALNMNEGTLRHIESAEFNVVQAISLYRTVDQPVMDALLNAQGK